MNAGVDQLELVVSPCHSRDFFLPALLAVFDRRVGLLSTVDVMVGTLCRRIWSATLRVHYPPE